MPNRSVRSSSGRYVRPSTARGRPTARNVTLPTPLLPCLVPSVLSVCPSARKKVWKALGGSVLYRRSTSVCPVRPVVLKSSNVRKRHGPSAGTTVTDPGDA